MIKYVAIIDGGNYETLPSVTIDTASGFGAILQPVLDNKHFYVFAGRPKAYSPDDSMPDPNYENVYDGFNFQYDQMYFGVKISNNDVAYVAPRYNWSPSAVYPEYDDKDTNLVNESFYVVTSDNMVFKCIYNNGGAPSTVEPSNTQSFGLPATQSDGYRWKYMFTITGVDETKFGTSTFIPVIKDANVVANAISGGIMNIKVESAGTNYPCLTGQVLGISGSQITISANATAVTNYYANSTLTVFGDGNQVNSMRILQSDQVGSNTVVNIVGTFNANQISVGFNYQIAPTLNVVGDGENFEGYLVMNQQSQSIVAVEILDSGTGYNIADAQVISGSGFGSGASLRPIISPPGGHGSDVYGELYSQYLGVSAQFANNIGLPNDVDIRTVGLLKDPGTYNSNVPFTKSTFVQTVPLQVANTTSAMFQIGEEIIGNVSRARGSVALCNSSVVTITGYTGQFLAGETLNGKDSGVQFIFNSANTTPDIKLYSGDILYLQNIAATQRSPTSSEQLKMIVKL
jgi:hypothetical protein